MIEHDIGTCAPADFSGCRSAADVERVLHGLPVRRLDWLAGMALVNRDTSALDAHPTLAALAGMKNRTAEVLDWLEGKR